MLTLQFYVLEGSARKIEFGRPDDKTRVIRRVVGKKYKVYGA